MRADLHCAQGEQYFRFASRIGRRLQIFSKCLFRFGKMFLLRSGVTEIKPEIRFDVSGIVDLAERGQIFFGSFVVLLVVIFEPEPFQNFRGNVGAGARLHEIIYFLRYRGLQRGHSSLVVLRVKLGFAYIILRLRRDGTLWKFLQQLAKRLRHAFGVLLLSEDQRLQLQRRFPFVRLRIFCQDRI